MTKKNNKFMFILIILAIIGFYLYENPSILKKIGLFSTIELPGGSSIEVSDTCKFIKGCGSNCVDFCATNGATCNDVCSNYAVCEIFSRDGKDYACVIDDSISTIGDTSYQITTGGGTLK